MPAKKVASPKKRATATKKTKSPKSVKKEKKEGPKRPTSAFMYFSMERRKQIVAEDPSLKSDIGGVAKKIGGEWRELSASAKQKFDTLAAKDRQRYENEKKKMP